MLKKWTYVTMDLHKMPGLKTGKVIIQKKYPGIIFQKDNDNDFHK